MLIINQLLYGDCLELMNGIPDASIDMILCDLPYGTTKNAWDTQIDLPMLWKQYERIIQDHGAIVLFAQPPFDKVLGASNLKMFRYEWIWEKSNITGHLNAKKMPLKKHENVLVFYKKLPTYNPQFTPGKAYSRTVKECNTSSNYGKQTGYQAINPGIKYPIDIIQFAYDKEKIHPTQKPVELCEYMINTYTNAGETVLDNCAGSGTTGIACINTGRNFILMEKDAHIYSLAKARIDAHTTRLLRAGNTKEDAVAFDYMGCAN